MKENNGDIEKVKQIIQKLKIEILEKEDKILHCTFVNDVKQYFL